MKACGAIVCPSSAARLGFDVHRHWRARPRAFGPSAAEGACSHMTKPLLPEVRRCKGEEHPALPVFSEANRVDVLAGKFGDGPRPEIERRNIRLHHANFPHSWKPLPHFMRDPSSNSAPPVCSENKELGHVPHVPVPRGFRTLLDQNEPRQFVVDPDKKRMTARLAPIERKMLVDEPSIRSNFNVVEFAEIMCVQMQQIGQDRRLLACSRHNFNFHEWHPRACHEERRHEYMLRLGEANLAGRNAVRLGAKKGDDLTSPRSRLPRPWACERSRLQSPVLRQSLPPREGRLR